MSSCLRELQRDILRLSSMLGGALALVSGRSLDAIDEVFGDLRSIPAAGMHGLERREPDGRRTFPPVAPESLDAVFAEAQHVAINYPGAIVERKGPNLALHWRAAPRRAMRSARSPPRHCACCPTIACRAATCARTAPRRRIAPDKGTAVEGFMAQAPFRGRRPVFVGDDLTDEHAFSIVNACQGLSVLVGDRTPSAARWRLPDPAAVRALARARHRRIDGVHA